jgi:serine/threonine protein kinase
MIGMAALATGCAGLYLTPFRKDSRSPRARSGPRAVRAVCAGPGRAHRATPGDDLGTAATVPGGDARSGDALGERPGGDQLVRAVARARIADALFAANEPVKLGRYQLLEVVGTGGMGVVWGAWDPELDRRVAIKLLNATIQAARERIVREGQALARLSHPNVVPIYDVGVVDDRVYLVMEWVRGHSLRRFGSAPRTVAELVAVYRAAGQGLAAAHRASLIHRDFKPENAILGDDGRVRVLDFGLARGEVRVTGDGDAASGSEDLTRGAGTPRYMAPEQADGTAVTPAVDQYALCVSLREALVGRRGDGQPAELPGWLARVLDRGTAPAADRYPSIDELLHALARDPVTVRRRRLVAAGAIAAVAAAFLVGTQRAAAPEAERCLGGAGELAGSWSPAVRSRLAAHMASRTTRWPPSTRAARSTRASATHRSASSSNRPARPTTAAGSTTSTSTRSPTSATTASATTTRR